LAGLSFAVLIHSIIPLLLLMSILILSIKKLKLRIYFQMLLDYPELKETYDDVIIHNNNLSTFVPAPLFDENFMGVICNTIPRF
jgi:hypothetical protein